MAYDRPTGGGVRRILDDASTRIGRPAKTLDQVQREAIEGVLNGRLTVDEPRSMLALLDAVKESNAASEGVKGYS